MAMIISPRENRFEALKSTLNYYLYGPHYVPLSKSLAVPETRLVKILPGTLDEPIHCELHRAVLWPFQNFERIRADFEDRYDTLAYVRYDALSYVWGDTSNKLPILVNGKELMITENLWAALKRLRKASVEDEWESLFWIDAICINQSNLVERSQQVQLMAQIYSMAQQVVVWLGEEDERSRVAFDLLNDHGFTEHYRSDNGPWAYKGHPWDEFSQLDAIRSTFRNRSWWKRLWVVQEICHAETIYVQCGSKRVEWKTLSRLHEILQGKWGNSNLTGQGPRLLKSLEVVGNMEAWRKSSKESNSQGMVSPEEASNDIRDLAVEIFGQRECTDPRDAIYGLLSISPLLAFIIPDYNLSAAEVYISAAKAIISIRQDLDILSRVSRSSSKQAQRSRKEKALPSWVPDWSSKMEYEDILSTKPDLLTILGKDWNASGDKKLPAKALSEHSGLLLRGVFWDQICQIAELYWAGNFAAGFAGDENAGRGLRNFMGKIANSERGLRGWSAFMTKTGQIGLSLGHVAVGDMIYIAYGSRVPLVLRTARNNSANMLSPIYFLTGTVYCEAIMYGEAVETMRLEYQDSKKSSSFSWIKETLSRLNANWRRGPKVLVKELVEEEIRLV